MFVNILLRTQVVDSSTTFCEQSSVFVNVLLHIHAGGGQCYNGV